MIREKIEQSIGILNETGIDLWLIFGRESHTTHEPCADLVIGAGYTWASAFLIARGGQTVAIIGNLDAAEFEKQGNYQRIIPFVGGIRESLRGVLQEFDPKTIAVNYSVDDVMSDGLTHGMWLQLRGHLEGTPYADRLVSSERIVSALRGRKSPEEIRRIQRAITETEKLFQEVHGFIQPGRTEKEIHDWLLGRVLALGYEPAWNPNQCPSVFTGVPEAGEAHTGPTDKKVERGHVINMDFGLKIDGYCSDLQRTWYVLREGETEAPPEVRKGFQAVVDAIAKSAESARPGVEGWTVDDVARKHIVGCGFEEFKHALGHQVGRSPHDGAGLFCPHWERYGQLPDLKVEDGQVYTLEPRVHIAGYGVATVEEIIQVTQAGGRFLSSFQRELWLIR
jgi:Xaa-Pro aminopeptidase